MKNDTVVERTSERELVTRRTFNGPARIVFDAWTRPELMKRWWTPRSMGMTIVACTMDVRIGGSYRLEILHPSSPEPMAFFGTYTDVVPGKRLVWTNDEGEGGQSITTVTFEEKDGKTLLVMHEIHPSKEALDEHLSGGAAACALETYDQLDALLEADATA